MPETVTSAITSLFAGPNMDQESTSVNFSWRLICRRNRPFLLLPEDTRPGPASLELYLAQRPLAKALRSLIPLILRTPAAGIFEEINVAADADSTWMRFLKQQAGLATGQLTTPAIKFGGIARRTSRLVMLLCDETGHPIRVIKVGLNAAGRTATEQEADLLSQLPDDLIGCTGITGRYHSDTLSAFATTYFPGASLSNDLGIEKLFHSWLNEAPREPLENLASWQELAAAAPGGAAAEWPLLRDALARHRVRTTLFHGDFTPWNVRMVNSENIRAFDWERGNLKGIPGWDWFHFIVQTSVLVKRHSRERIAAELEQLFHSPRFQKYAEEAGISQIIEPLLLAYLLHQQLVVQPEEGRERSQRLFALLWEQWRMRQGEGLAIRLAARPARRSAGEQLQAAAVKLANLLWEPGLSPAPPTPLLAQYRRHWLPLLGSLLWMGGVALVHYHTNTHLMMTPFYLLPCVCLVYLAGRAPALLAAVMAAVAGPGLQYFTHPGEVSGVITVWNIGMRILVFQLIVILLHNSRRTNGWYQPLRPLAEPSAWQAFSLNWAVVLGAGLFLALLLPLNILASPHCTFLPLYLLPCLVLTLTLNPRWGTLAAILAAGGSALAQHLGDPVYFSRDDTLWNAVMRLVIFQGTVLLLGRMQAKTVLFSDGKT